MKFEWNVKKSITLGLLLLSLAFLGLSFLPMYSVYVAEGTYAYGTVIESFQYPSPDSAVGLAIGAYIAYGVLDLVGAFFYLRSLISNPEDGDKEDKFFVFGSWFLTLSHGVFMLFAFSMHHTLAIVLGVVGVAIGIASIVLHYKKLSNI